MWSCYIRPLSCWGMLFLYLICWEFFFYQEWVFVLNGFSILIEMCVCVCVCVCMLSHVQLFAVPWTVACQAHLPMKFSRQEYWSGVLVSTAGDLLTQGLTLCLLCLLHWQEDSSPLVPPWKPCLRWWYDLYLQLESEKEYVYMYKWITLLYTRN